MAESAKKTNCRTCGKSIPSFAPGGHCPPCLLRSVGTESDPLDSSWESRFSILDELGEGGFGKVFLAEQHTPVRRLVALKVIKPGMSDREVIARFEVERQTLASLDHTNIARIYDAGELSDGRPAIAMEYVPGAAINKFADDEDLSLKERLDLFLQVCRGVEHAHLHGIIHRDLKPGNLLAFRDADGTPAVRIIDFGIAKATRQRAADATLVTLQALALGTPAYMSPEQAEGRLDTDVRSDVYSLGAILYELLSGTPPLETSKEISWGEMLSQIQNSSARRPSETLTKSTATLTWNAKELKGDLDWIALTAISKDRERRYQSVAELRRDVEAHLQGRAVEARSPSKRYRMKKLILRHRVASVAIAAAVVALITGTIVSSVMAIQAGRARRNAEVAEAAAVEERERSREMFSRSDFQQGCQLLDDDQFEAGVAHLCRALRTDPENLLAADRLLTSLAYTNFLAPLTKEARHPSRNIAVFFRNEREFITVCEESVIGIWDRETGERIGNWLDQDGIDISQSAISEDRDHLLTGSYQGPVHVWDLPNRKIVFKADNDGVVSVVRSVSFLDHHRVAAGFANGWVRVWDFRNDRLLWEKNFDHDIWWVDASPDGESLAISCSSEAILLDSEDGTRLVGFPHAGTVWRARFSSEGERLLTASQDGTARIWNVANGRPLTPPMRHELSLYDVSWSPDGTRVATMAIDNQARLWSAKTGQPLSASLRHDDDVYMALIPENGTRLVTGSRDQRLRYWDTSTSQLAAASSIQQRSVSNLALEDTKLLVGGRHEQVRHLDLRARAAQPIRIEFPGNVEFIRSENYGKAMRVLYQTHQEMVLEKRDLKNGKTLGKPQRFELPATVYLAKNSERFAVKHDKSKVSLFDGAELIVPPFQFPTQIAHLEIDNNGRFVFLCGVDGKAMVISLDEPSEGELGLEVITLEPFDGEVFEDVILAGQPLQIALKSGQEIRIFDLETRQWLTGKFRHPAKIGMWDFNPDHRLLIAGGFDDTASLWNSATGDLLGGRRLEHTDANSYKTVKVKLSPDGRFAITSSWHELGCRIWNAADGSPVTNLLYQNGHILGMAIDPTSRYLAAYDDTRILRLWSIADGQSVMPAQGCHKSLRDGRFTIRGESFLAIEDHAVVIWPLPACSKPPGDRVITMSEKIVGRHLDDDGVLHWLPDTPHTDLRSQLPSDEMNKEDSSYRWLNWIIGEPDTRSRTLPN